jgi:8-oxo-dGTP pyrophosphatase MutT (NUDIX family)
MGIPKLEDLIDEAEVAQLQADYGPGRRCRLRSELTESSFDYGWRKLVVKRSRRGEVVLAIQRPDGKVLLHTKAFYPPGIYRLPTGGVHPGESVLAGAMREAREETGLGVTDARFLGMVEYEFHQAERRMPFVSYVLLAQADDSIPTPEDTSERISGFRYVPAIALRRVADALRHLPEPWADWGAFRALPHDMVADALLGVGLSNDERQ